MRIIFNPSVPLINNIKQINGNKFRYNKAVGYDEISFGRNPKILGAKEAERYVEKYTTSTSGYRGEYGKDFNDRFVYTMTQAASKYMNEHKNRPVPLTLIGGDTREATKKYSTIIASDMRNNGIDVMYPQLEDTKRNGI